MLLLLRRLRLLRLLMLLRLLKMLRMGIGRLRRPRRGDVSRLSELRLGWDISGSCLRTCRFDLVLVLVLEILIGTLEKLSVGIRGGSTRLLCMLYGRLVITYSCCIAVTVETLSAMTVVCSYWTYALRF